jgi:uncharacterized membrane protein
MMRTILWVLAGIFAGVLIHLIVILSLPALASHDVWSRVTELGANNKAVVLPAVVAGAPNPLRLDPELSYAVCQMNLSTGPGVVSGTLPDAFWSLAVYNRSGAVIYSTTNRDGIGQTLDLGIFNVAQTRLLAQQKLDIAEGLLIVESTDDDVFVVVRLAPPYPAVRQRYETMLGAIQCGNINSGG